MTERANQQGAVPHLQTIVESAFAETPLLYTNGFVNGVGLTDAYLILQANGRSIATVNMSLSLAKTLGQSLLAMVQSVEEESGEVIATLEELQQRAERRS